MASLPPPVLSPAPPLRRNLRSGQDGIAPPTPENSVKPGARKSTLALAGHDPLFLWTVTVCVCVLAAGWSGMRREAWSPGVLSGYTEEEASGGMEAMLDEPADAAAPEEAVSPPAESVETEQPVAPEPEEALTVEDVLEIPPPPVLETVERSAIPPVPRENPRPKPRPQPVKPAVSAVKPQPVSRPANTGAASAPARPPAGTGAGDGAGASGGGGGRGAKGSGKAKTPQPSYPAFARSEKMTGTVVVSLVVDPSGAVVSATVIRSCGHPRLDAHTCSFIRSRWRWPAGERRTHTVPVIYRLR